MNLFLAALGLSPGQPFDRRLAITGAAAAASTLGAGRPASALQKQVASTLDMKLSASGLKWADLRVGQGSQPAVGQRAVIDYMMTRRGGYKIYSTVDSKQPFEWTLGDGSVIEGLELAVLGGGDLPPLRQGGARRVFVPQVLGYGKDRGFFSGGTPTEIRDLGPVPPAFVWFDLNDDKVNSYLRFKNIYQDENRLDQPDLILDISLRAVKSAEPASPPQAAAATSPAAEPSPSAPTPVAAPAPPPPTAATATASDAQLEQLRLQLETQTKELAALQEAQARYKKLGFENGGSGEKGYSINN